MRPIYDLYNYHDNNQTCYNKKGNNVLLNEYNENKHKLGSFEYHLFYT